MIGVENQRMSRTEFEGSPELFLSFDQIGGTELLHDGCGQTLAFLQFGSNQEPHTLDFRQFRLHIPPAAGCEGIRRNDSGITAHYSGDRIPERTFAVGTVPVSDNHRFLIHLTDGGKTDNPLDIVNQFLIILKNQIQRFLP